MECFKFGFNFPEIQKKSTVISSKVLVVRGRVKRTRPRRRYYHPRPRTVLVTIPPKPVMKIYVPHVFSLELDNMFDVLDL